MMVTSTFSIFAPMDSNNSTACLRNMSDDISFHLASEGGKYVPISSFPAAPKGRLSTHDTLTSASECPSRERLKGISIPHKVTNS